MSVSETTLTAADLDRALEDDRHLGFGYATRGAIVPLTDRKLLDESVVATANRLGWTYDDLFHWANSNHGRWLVDHFEGRPSQRAFSVADIVSQYVTDSTLRDARQ